MSSTRVVFKTTYFEQQMQGYPEEMTREDVLQDYINLLELKESKKDFAGARDTLDSIKALLDEPDSIKSIPEEDYCRTLLATHHMIRANPIRLRYKDMDITGYFKLLVGVKNRLFNKNPRVIEQRTVVAEEMSKLNLFPQMITEKWQLREIKAPNRAFMDVLYKVRPEFAEDDILRREYTNLSIAWNKKDQNALNEVRKKIAVLGGTDFTEELKRAGG